MKRIIETNNERIFIWNWPEKQYASSYVTVSFNISKSVPYAEDESSKDHLFIRDEVHSK